LKKSNIIYFIGQIGLGGSERQLYLLLKYLNRTDLVFHVIVFNNSPYGDLKRELFKIGVKLYFLPKDKKTILERFIYLYKLVKKINPILIHSWTIHDNAYAGILGKILNIKSVGSMRGSMYGTGFTNLSYVLKQTSLRIVDVLIVNAKSLKKEAIDFGLPEKKIKYISNCVEVYKDNRTISKEFIVCCIGNLRKNKNHSFFINIMKDVIDDIPLAKGWIIGQPVDDEPNVQNELTNEIRIHQLEEKVYLLGFQSNIIKLLKKCSILVVSSKSEGMPNVVLEAMSIGIPVISSNVGGLSELIHHGKNGLLCSIKNKTEFADAIKLLLTKTHLNRKLGANGKKFILARYLPSRTVHRFNNFYFDLLGI
tara:strand:+ start:2670 stop:3767 length:1098 start_codon:yes stop_codon:yes gene_type:complete